WRKTGRPSLLGAACGAVAGLVAITPAAGFVSPLASMAIGGAAGVVCFAAVNLKTRLGYDDSLDVVGVHLVGGIVGSVLLGVFAQNAVNSSVPDGLLFGGAAFFLKQVVAVLAVMVASYVASLILAHLVDRLVGLRVDETQEDQGLDISLHQEQGYALAE